MLIRFIKKENEKHVLSCTRQDGTVTWMNLDSFFLQHDLLYYAVETGLSYRFAFYGMLANGVSIADFELPKEKRNIIFTSEALYAEHLVNLIAVERTCGNFDDFNSQLHQSLRQDNGNVDPISITAEELANIHAAYDHLLHRWQKLEAGEVMTLDF